jgi:predicted ATP-grasp superfamily ATP-dependent carboligase
MKSVLITDGLYRKSLAAARSLGSKNIKVYISETTRFTPSGFSKYCYKSLVSPEPQKNREEYFKWMIDTIVKYKIDVIFPMDDATMSIVVEYREEIEKHSKILIPPTKSYMESFDKARTANYLKGTSLKIPKTKTPESIEDIDDVIKNFRFPVIIKARDKSGGRGIKIVDDKKGFIEAFKEIHAVSLLPIIQEFINDGVIYDVFFLYNKEHNEVARFMQETVRKYPLDTGPSTVARIVYNEKIFKAAKEVISNFKWTGMVNIEILYVEKTDEHFFVELNPRFGNSLYYALRSGVDFAWYMYKIAMEEKVSVKSSYKTGSICRNLFPSDFLHYFLNPERKKMQPKFFDFKSYYINDDIITKDDKMPFIGFLLACGRYLFNKNMWKALIRR